MVSGTLFGLATLGVIVAVSLWAVLSSWHRGGERVKTTMGRRRRKMDLCRHGYRWGECPCKACEAEYQADRLEGVPKLGVGGMVKARRSTWGLMGLALLAAATLVLAAAVIRNPPSTEGSKLVVLGVLGVIALVCSGLLWLALGQEER